MSFPPNPGYQQQPQPGYGQAGAPGYGPPANIADWYASWGSRAGAILIDVLISLVFTLPFTIPGQMNDQPALILAGNAVGIAVMLFQMHRQGTTGSTIGKKLLGIRVVRESDGQFTGFGMAVVRQIAHTLDALPCGLGFLWPLWDAKKQTWADKICSTLVIKNP